MWKVDLPQIFRIFCRDEFLEDSSDHEYTKDGEGKVQKELLEINKRMCAIHGDHGRNYR